jgi:hypothetical protein
MKSIDLTKAIIKPRNGVKKGSRYFSRSQKLNQITREKKRKEKRSECIAILLAEKEKARKERKEREESMARLRAMASNPDQKILRSKDGSLYYQPRQNGKFGKRVAV